MINLLRAELFKVKKSKGLFVLFVIMLISAIGMAVMAHLIAKDQISASLSGLVFMFSDVNMFSIIGAVAASIIICADFEVKTVQAPIFSGYNRYTMVFSKALTLFSFSILFILPFMVVTFVGLQSGSAFQIQTGSIGFLHILTTEAGVSNVWKYIIVSLALMFVYMSQTSVCILLAYVMKKPVFVVSAYYALTILLAQLSTVSEKSVLGGFMRSTPFGGKHAMLTMASSMSDIINAFTISIQFIFIMIGLAFLYFRRAEIK